MNGDPPRSRSARWLALGCALAALARAGAPRSQEAELVRQGRYLVHDVAHCIQCHTPRDQAGDLVPERLLEGAPVPVEAPFQQREWAVRAPHVRGLPGYTDEQAVRLLTRGVAAGGGSPRPPMPPFRMNEEDARAVVAYLRSLVTDDE